jgi:hypothetical protein
VPESIRFSKDFKSKSDIFLLGDTSLLLFSGEIKSNVNVPDADETSKSLEAVKALLESSIANGSIAMNES